MTDLTSLPAHQLARLIRARDVSSVEVVRAHLEKIESLQPQTHAMVQFDPALSLAAAKAADAQMTGSFTPGPLHGVPFTVKDWLETNDFICSAGYAERKDFRPSVDATVVARMRAAGGIILGKTKAGAVEDLYPLALNPHNPAHTAGASSAGEASIIAAGGSPLGLGSDSGGSLRWPAHCCGIATIKPTSGVVPLTGHYPHIIALTDPRTVIGPMARCAVDLALTLPILAGQDAFDASVVPVQLPAFEKKITDLSVAWFTGFAHAEPDAETIGVINKVVQALADEGASITEAAPPRIDEAFDITRAYWSRPESESLESWQPWGTSTLSADEVETSLFHWDRLRRAFHQHMQQYDVIICPVGKTPATQRLDVKMTDYVYTVPFSLSGNPVVVIKAGTSATGLPIGIQVVAPAFQEYTALGVAAFIESTLA